MYIFFAMVVLYILYICRGLYKIKKQYVGTMVVYGYFKHWGDTKDFILGLTKTFMCYVCLVLFIYCLYLAAVLLQQ